MTLIDLPKIYDGLRFTADANDCAMPIAMDSHSGCDFICQYCFSNNLMRNPERYKAKRDQLRKLGVKQTEWDIKKLYAFLRRELTGDTPRAMYPLLDAGQPIQLGALGEPFDNMEAKTGWALKAMEAFTSFKQPCRVSTKGAKTILRDEYLDAFKQASKYMWVNFSIIHPEDDILTKIDVGAPNATERFEAMKALSDMGVKVGLRYRPIIPQLAYKKVNGEPCWKIMLDKAVEAGATGISYEIIFLDQGANMGQRRQYRRMSKTIGFPEFPEWWKQHSVQSQACIRANRLLKYGLLTNIRDYAKELGLVIGISTPHLKEYSETVCCCGIPEDDPVFGGFSRDNTTRIVIEGRRAYEERGENLQFTYNDWAPEWSKHIRKAAMCALGSAEGHARFKHCTWYDDQRNKWNNPQHFRSPYYYYEGILHPIGTDDNKDVIYEYRHWAGQVFKDVERLERYKKLDRCPDLLKNARSVFG